jgi:threonine-phosphate decarboxylase
VDFQHGGNIWAADREKGLALQKVIDFSANINPLGPPPAVLKLLREKINYIQFYPESQAKSLCEAYAEKLGVNAGQIIFGNGASELITLFFQAIRPRQVLLPAPVYSDYARAASSAGSKVNFFFARDNFAYSLELLEEEISNSRPDALVFCNPNNPAGVFWEDVTPLLKASAEKGIPFLLDASFLPFTGVEWFRWQENNRFLSFLQDEAAVNGFQLFLVFSLTKIFALPGLRLGFGVGPSSLIKELKAAKDPWSVNSLAQLAGFECLRNQAYIKKSVALVEWERKYLYHGLKKIPGLKPFPSSANFLLCDCRRTGLSAAEIAAALAPKGLLIRDAGNFAGLDRFYFRVAVRKRGENRRLVRELRLLLLGPA